MGKNIKNYATSQQSISLGKGGIPYGKKSKSFSQNMVRLNRTHSFLHSKFTSKIFQIYVLSFGKISSELYKFSAIHPKKKILRIMHNSHRLSTIHYTFRCLTSGRELSEIPVNQAKSTSFAHKSR